MAQVYIDPTVRSLRDLHSDILGTSYENLSIRDRLAIQANSIFDGHRQGNSAVTFHLGSWCTDFIGTAPEQIMSSSLSLDQAQQTIASEHGFKDWSEVNTLQDVMLDVAFEQTVDAVLQGDIDQLQQHIDASPGLINQKSQYGHRATLLHYIGANGVESYRQITPLNAADVVQFLINAGADVNATAKMYGGGSTTLNLVLSSAHPYNAGVTTAVADALKRAGAV